VDRDGEETISFREQSGLYFAASKINTGSIFSGKTTHSGLAKCAAELKLKYKLIEIKANVRINGGTWVKSSFIRFNIYTLKVYSVILCRKIHSDI